MSCLTLSRDSLSILTTNQNTTNVLTARSNQKYYTVGLLFMFEKCELVVQVDRNRGGAVELSH